MGIVFDESLPENEKSPYYEEYWGLKYRVDLSNEKQWEYQKNPLWINLASSVLLV